MPTTTMWGGHNAFFFCYRTQKRPDPKHTASKRQRWSLISLLNRSFRHFVSTPRAEWTAGKAKLEMIWLQTGGQHWSIMVAPPCDQPGGVGEAHPGRDGQQDGWPRASWSQRKPQSGSHLTRQALFWKRGAFHPHPLTSSYSDYYLARSLSPALSNMIKPEGRACDSATPRLSSWPILGWPHGRPRQGLCLLVWGAVGGGYRRPERKKSCRLESLRSGPGSPGPQRPCPQALPLLLLHPRSVPDPSPRPTHKQPFKNPKSWAGQYRHFQFQGVLSLVRREVQDSNYTHWGAPGGRQSRLCLHGGPHVLRAQGCSGAQALSNSHLQSASNLHQEISRLTRAVICIWLTESR